MTSPIIHADTAAAALLNLAKLLKTRTAQWRQSTTFDAAAVDKAGEPTGETVTVTIYFAGRAAKGKQRGELQIYHPGPPETIDAAANALQGLPRPEGSEP